MRKYKTPVKASKLIAALEAESFQAEVTDNGDLYPFFSGISLEVDEDTHVCSLGTGYYSYHEDCATSGLDSGLSEVTVLGVRFSKAILCDEEDDDIEISGREIEYDKDFEESDVFEAAKESIHFVGYDPDDFPFDEESVTDEEIKESLESDCDYDVFALNGDGVLCAFECEEDVVELNEEQDDKNSKYKIISAEDAFDILCKQRPNDWDFGG